jgi:hypothetical protein
LDPSDTVALPAFAVRAKLPQLPFVQVMVSLAVRESKVKLTSVPSPDGICIDPISPLVAIVAVLTTVPPIMAETTVPTGAA